VGQSTFIYCASGEQGTEENAASDTRDFGKQAKKEKTKEKMGVMMLRLE
jgi:hypothetical protein